MAPVGPIRRVLGSEYVARRQWRLSLECGHVVTHPRVPGRWVGEAACHLCPIHQAPVQLDLIEWLNMAADLAPVQGNRSVGGTG